MYFFEMLNLIIGSTLYIYSAGKKETLNASLSPNYARYTIRLGIMAIPSEDERNFDRPCLKIVQLSFFQMEAFTQISFLGEPYTIYDFVPQLWLEISAK